MQVCTADVQCTDGFVHYLRCTDIVELCTYTDVFFWFQLLICPAGWPVGSDWLLQGVTPIQVQAHYFNQHQPSGLLTPRPVAFTAGLGAGSANAGAAAGSSPPAGGAARCRACGQRGSGAARVVDASLVLGRCSSVLLVLELALDHLGLGTTAGALNSLDVLIKGC